ncbi:MAG: cation:proton antiporter [Holophaga sp.]|nr:cation:proton antiporter [Holophaga sp.]
MVLGVAAVISLVFRRLKQPAVLGYMLAGLIVGPHVPIPLVADLENVQTMAELGVVLLMFSVGLEFDFRKLLDKGPTAMVLGAIQLGFTTWLGFMTGRALGWSFLQSAFMGAALAISSTMIIAKLFEEHGAKGHLRDRVLAVLVVQDLFAILLLAGLDATSASGGFGAGGLGLTLGKVALLLAGLLGIGGMVVPRLLRWAADQGRDETLLVASVGVCFTAAVLADMAGCSLALGAFLAGVLAGASGRVQKIEHLVLPLRDIFAAIFFVAVGMLLEPRSLAAQAGPILALTAVVLLGQPLGATLGGALAGLPLRTGFRTGLALAQPGEFSFVLVGIGVHAKFLGPDLMAVPVGVCLLTALLGPTLFRRGDALAAGLERRIPARINWYLKAYQSWAARLGRFTLGRGPAPLRRPLIFLVLDAALMDAVIIAVALLKRHQPWVQNPNAALGLLGAQAILLALLAWALCGRASEIAERILTPAPSLQAPPLAGRRHLQASLSLALVLAVAAPSLALLQPFLPEGPLLVLFLAGLAGLLGLLWVHSRRFPPDRATGSEWLLRRVRAPWARSEPEELGPPALLSLRLTAQCPVLDLPLGELALEQRTGATILGLTRAGHPVAPNAELELQADDLLALHGSPAALEAARRLLEAQS